MTTNGTDWRANSRRDDLADAPEAADDEVLVELVEHAFAAAEVQRAWRSPSTRRAMKNENV